MGGMINIIETEATLGVGPAMRDDERVKRDYIEMNEIKAARMQMKTYRIQTAADCCMEGGGGGGLRFGGSVLWWW